jgi:hypothetical protein
MNGRNDMKLAVADEEEEEKIRTATTRSRAGDGCTR